MKFIVGTLRGPNKCSAFGEGNLDVRYDPQPIMLAPFSKESFGTLRSPKPLRYRTRVSTVGLQLWHLWILLRWDPYAPSNLGYVC